MGQSPMKAMMTAPPASRKRLSHCDCQLDIGWGTMLYSLTTALLVMLNYEARLWCSGL